MPTESSGPDPDLISMNRSLPSEETTRSFPDPAEFVLQLPSDLRMIEAAVCYLAHRCRLHAFRGPRLSLNFRVGITEALANAVLYGNRADPRKQVRVEVSIDSSRVTLLVEDEGHGFDPDAIPDPRLPENRLRPGGRGLFLIRQLMDEVEFSESGNAVRLVLLREAPRKRQAVGR